jgi:hypothetical protein
MNPGQFDIPMIPPNPTKIKSQRNYSEKFAKSYEKKGNYYIGW